MSDLLWKKFGSTLEVSTSPASQRLPLAQQYIPLENLLPDSRLISQPLANLARRTPTLRHLSFIHVDTAQPDGATSPLSSGAGKNTMLREFIIYIDRKTVFNEDGQESQKLLFRLMNNVLQPEP